MAAPKSFMFSARVPRELIDRVDYVVNNTPLEAVRNRSHAIQKALEDWLPGHEHEIRKLLGPDFNKKTR